MKLYSRGQMLFFSALSALIVGMLALGFGLVKWPIGGDKAEIATAEVPAEEPTFALRQSQSDPKLLRTSDLASFSEDERENISVYVV